MNDSMLQTSLLLPVENSQSELDNCPPSTVPVQTTGIDFRSSSNVGEDAFTTIIKRLYAQLGLIVMTANTVTSVFSISAAVSLIPDDDAGARYNFCTYGGNGIAVYVQCPYIPSPVFQTILSIWCIYFAVFFSYKYYKTSCFETDDLRFYVYCDQFNSTIMNRVMIGLGVLLTFISAIGGINFVIHNGTTDSIGPILIFCAVNVYNLALMGVCKFKILAAMDIYKSEAFKLPIMINTEMLWSVFNLNGLLLSHVNIFAHISDAVSMCVFTSSSSSSSNNSSSNDYYLAKIGSVRQLKAAMEVLNPLRTQP